MDIIEFDVLSLDFPFENEDFSNDETNFEDFDILTMSFPFDSPTDFEETRLRLQLEMQSQSSLWEENSRRRPRSSQSEICGKPKYRFGGERHFQFFNAQQRCCQRFATPSA